MYKAGGYSAQQQRSRPVILKTGHKLSKDQ